VQPGTQPVLKAGDTAGFEFSRLTSVSSSNRFGSRQSQDPAKHGTVLSRSIFSNASVYVYSVSLSWIVPSSDSFFHVSAVRLSRIVPKPLSS